MIFDLSNPLALAVLALVVAGLVVGAVRSRRYRWVFGGIAIALVSLPVIVMMFVFMLLVASAGSGGF